MASATFGWGESHLAGEANAWPVLIHNGFKHLLKSLLKPLVISRTISWAYNFKSTKGQLISKCPFGFIIWTKIPTKLFLDFCPEFFCSFLGASWKLFGLPGDLVCNIINKEACRKPKKASRKPPGRYKKFQGRNSEIILLVILSKRWNQRDILKSTDLYQNTSVCMH